jgi:hypothetical protein
MRYAWYIADTGEKMNAYRFLVGVPEGKKPLGRHRWEDSIKMEPRGTG